MFFQIFLFIASSLLQAALAPKAPKPKPLSLGQFDVPTAEVGTAIPVVFGSCLVKSPNVVWYGDLKRTKIKSKKGKK